jgi:hypothetical protein
MYAEIIPGAYDVCGRQVFRPDVLRRKKFGATFPIGRFFSQPLKRKYASLEEMRKFLMTCRYVSDKEQFGKDDYWQPPEFFEQTRNGDCDDFAIWTWRQLFSMGYPARLTLGRADRYGTGHAWVTFQMGGKTFLVEPQMWIIPKLPQLSIIRYHPQFSVEWDADQKKARFFEHKPMQFKVRAIPLFIMILEWIRRWGWLWITLLWKIVAALATGTERWMTGGTFRKKA